MPETFETAQPPSNPKPAIAETKAGLKLYAARKLSDAIVKFELRLSKSPDDVSTPLAYTVALIEVDRRQEDHRAAQRAAKLGPKNTEAHLLLCGFYQDVNQSDAAIAPLEEYLALEPDGKHSLEAHEVLETLKRERH